MTAQPPKPTSKPSMKKTVVQTTELFKNKKVPEFITTHKLFREARAVQKVFPSIGLPNFKEKANVDKCLVDIKKEGTYVHNLLKQIAVIAQHAQESVNNQADRLQYLGSKETREKDRAKLQELYGISTAIGLVAACTDPYNQEVLDNAIYTTSDNKVALRLMKDIAIGDGKPIFTKGSTLFSVLHKMKEKCNSVGAEITSLEQTEAFKTFSKENIPNKEFNVVFSSTGEEGAWDLLTMSMRGITSCQRWEGEYPRCLIGSVLSKFVGILYLTSGVMNTGDEKNGNRSDLGAKMMRRCVVRYAVDADNNKPCILIDKMYPDLDKDILSVFVSNLQSRTKLPVHYAPDLGNKLRHIYVPHEKVRDEILEREWSYQDTPLKSKNDINIYILNHSKDEMERDVKGLRVNLGIFMARRLEEIYTGSKSVSPEVKQAIFNLRLNTSFTPFCDSVVQYILNAFRPPNSKGLNSSKAYYRKYLMEFLSKRKQTFAAAKPQLTVHIQNHTSRTLNESAFADYLCNIATEFSKLEAAKLVS